SAHRRTLPSTSRRARCRGTSARSRTSALRAPARRLRGRLGLSVRRLGLALGEQAGDLLGPALHDRAGVLKVAGLRSLLDQRLKRYGLTLACARGLHGRLGLPALAREQLVGPDIGKAVVLRPDLVGDLARRTAVRARPIGVVGESDVYDLALND